MSCSQVFDLCLEALSPVFNQMYVAFGRSSIAPKKLLRALLLQVLYPCFHGKE
jgi:transposase